MWGRHEERGRGMGSQAGACMLDSPVECKRVEGKRKE